MATCPTCHGSFENATFCPRDGSRLEANTDAGALIGGRYRLLRKVGEGAMGVVFEAEHASIRRRVAVKILQRKLVASAEMVERLRREAQVTSGLGHPNIVECLDFGTEDGQVYLVMEWLDGETLEERLERSQIDVDTVLEIGAQTCAGLAEAHERGVIHRDLKPANLFLTRDRGGALRVKILDFGIAKLAAEQTQLTSTGVLVGTPNYMAPEQALGERIDGRADIYALGVILYELFVGRVPFQGDTPLAVLHQHTAKMPTLPSAVANGGLSPEIDALVMTCLAKAPEDRFQTMTELAAAIERARSRAKVPSRVPANAPSTPPPADDDDEDVDLHTPRRRRGALIAVGALAVLAAGGVVIATALRPSGERPIARHDAAAFVPSSVVDANVNLSPSPADAPGVADAAIDGPSEKARIVQARAARFALEARVTPDHAHHDEPITLAITISELDDIGLQTRATGRLELRITVEHFLRHDVVARETLTVDQGGRATFVWTPRRGKHHVVVESIADGVSLGRARFDVHAE